MTERRAPVQGDLSTYWRRRAHPLPVPDGSIAWSEHLTVFEAYARKYGHAQSAETIAARHGFGYREIETLTGKAPATWEPRESKL